MLDKNFFDLTAKFEKNIDDLNQVLKGDDSTSILIDDVLKPSISKALNDKWNAIHYGIVTFTTYAELDAYIPLTTEQKGSFKVTNDANSALNGYYSWISGTAYTKDADLVVNTIDALNTSDAVSGLAVHNNTAVRNIPFKRTNLLNTSQSAIQGGLYINFVGDIEVTPSKFAATYYTKIEQGKTYVISGLPALLARASLFLNEGDTNGKLVTFTDVTGGKTFSIGESETNLWICFVVEVTETAGDIVVKNVQLEENTVVTDFEKYELNLNAYFANYISTDKIVDYISKTPSSTEVLSTKAINRELNKNNIQFKRENILDTSQSAIQAGFYLNVAGDIIAITASPVAASEYVELEQGKTYTLSGAVNASWRAFIFANAGDTTDGDEIIFTDVDGGKKFTVGASETKLFFVVNLTVTKNAGNIIAGNTQLEEGEVVTDFKGYPLNTNDLFIRATDKQKTERVTAPFYENVNEKLPLFFDKKEKRVQDLRVVTWGTSLSVREGNNTYYDNPQNRPPLCASRNWPSRVWDRIRFGYELFYRFDADGLDLTPRFTETGAFVTVVPNISNTPSHGIDDTIWDDFQHREGITRMFSGAGTASISFDIEYLSFDKEGCCDFIYRTDTSGSTVNTITVAEGNGLAVVLDDNDVETELNGHVFTMRHGGVETYKGNTKFNAKIRIKFITDTFDSRNFAKTITITKTDETDTRFMYWGIQTSREKYMASIVSAGRGGQDFISMEPFTDDDIFGHNPDLLISEIPINGGINTANNAELPQYYVDQTNNWFFNLTNPRSIKSKSNSWVDFNLLIWTPGTTESVFNGFDDNFKTYKLTDSNFYGVHDNWRQISLLMRDQKENGFFFINTFEQLLNESVLLYGSKKAGFTISSTTSSESFVKDGIHYNDFGLSILEKYLPF